ncbi:MAG: 4-hydroxythreonine-4-phosphate dehydrogenase PdxA [Rhodospirillaceae bacterium]|nr:4-hydroxythreonine-4-phosphate dehydrogenase PdxA [Rhodospirillaceae bacterium]
MVYSCSPIAVTMGDPNGIGGEITIKAWMKDHSSGNYPFFLIDDPVRIQNIVRQMNVDVPIRSIEKPELANNVFGQALPILEEKLNMDFSEGHSSSFATQAIIRSIDRALDAVLSGAASAMVTNPIKKSTLYDAGFCYPGHTEYLANQTKAQKPAVMMLETANLRVVPVTIHLSLKEAIDVLSIDKIVLCTTTTATALKQDFGINRPCIAVAGLNPHAGEDGFLGQEEIEIITPAINQLQATGLNVIGPFASDTLFHQTARKKYDAVICMYHDQALIPSKTIDFYNGVNITLGLPIVRTSPDHGTAADIAGTNRANPNSFIAAIQTAGQIAATRQDMVNAYDTA